MSKTFVNVFKTDAQVNVSLSTSDIHAIQAILLRHLNGVTELDEKSWNTIQDLCEKIEQSAIMQDQMERKEVEF